MILIHGKHVSSEGNKSEPVSANNDRRRGTMNLYELTARIELLSPSEIQFVWDYGIALERACFHDYCYCESIGSYFDCIIHSDFEWEKRGNEVP